MTIEITSPKLTGSDVRLALNFASLALDRVANDSDRATLRFMLDFVMPHMGDEALVAFAEAVLKHLGAAAEYRKGV